MFLDLFLHQVSTYNYTLSCFALVVSHALHQKSVTSSRVGSESCTFPVVPPGPNLLSI